VYAPRPQPVSSPVVVRLIGILDASLVDAFVTLERGLVGRRGAVMLVDVRDLQVIGASDADALARAIAVARAAGRDVRIDARGITWRRALRKTGCAPAPIDAELRSTAARTVILAHSGKRKPT